MPLYIIQSVRDAALVLLDFAGSADRARAVMARIGKEKLPARKKREFEVTHLLLMAHSLRRHVKSDTAAMKRAIALRHGTEVSDDEVRNLRYWLKGQTLAKFARTQPCKYVFTPPNKFSFFVTKSG